MKFGTIALDGSNWVITCEPHVRGRLRRVFPQVSQRAGDSIALTDNEENSRDLLWFTQRYPMQMSRAALQWMKNRASGHVEAQSRVIELLSNRRPPDDFVLAKPAREYQKTAGTLLEIKTGLLLADDVGLGKTVSGICAMARADNLPVLVVTLTHLPEQWKAEINAFAPELKVHILKSGQPYDLIPKPHGNKKQAGLFDVAMPRLPDVIISNYHKLHGWAETLAGLVRYVIYDECQDLRNQDSNKYAAAKHIASKAKLRLGLSATPIYNLGAEFFSVINVLLPGSLGSYEEFHREWCIGEGTIGDPKAFGSFLRREGIMLRRTRKDVGRELPPCMRIVQTISTDQSVLDTVKSSAVELAKVILASQQSYQGQKFRASEEFNVMLRQATGVAKAPYVAEFVRMLMASEEKVILFGWHREVYGIWLELLAEFKPMLYTGSESPKQKAATKEAFVNGDCRVMIISLRAGAGLDGLQRVCKVGVFGELDWSPGVHEQCGGRYWRDGQDEPSLAYFLLSEDGSDPVIADILGLKKGQIDGVRDPDADLVETYAVEPGSIKKLAKAYLERLGVALPPVVEMEDIRQLAA
ncbi:SNF2-related (plasmid) [Rhodoferax ferrireducens T118]|uniref:SNF2-related n=1 Tax=Albidiferax ferrireducens (strain ATCC BAA-621 / DSM 15236 / T118) TaxID=338969 RepID=Q21PZ2_ALBFT|nr:DEAD/DEAH box helicase [Rhodoferax ferrireducens]ABD72153.1 SNF2-related [Rhodoferax ferrireducens T118]